MNLLRFALAFLLLTSQAFSSIEYEFIPQPKSIKKKPAPSNYLTLPEDVTVAMEGFFILDPANKEITPVRALAFLDKNKLPQEQCVPLGEQVEGWLALLHWKYASLKAEQAKEFSETAKQALKQYEYYQEEADICLQAGCEFGNPNAIVMTVKKLRHQTNPFPNFMQVVELIDRWVKVKHIRAMQIKRNGLTALHDRSIGYCGYDFNPIAAAKINEELIQMGSLEARQYRREFAGNGDSANNPYPKKPSDYVRLTNELCMHGHQDAFTHKIKGLLLGQDGYERNVAEARELLWDHKLVSRIPEALDIGRLLYQHMANELNCPDNDQRAENCRLLIDWMADMLHLDWAIENRIAQLLTGASHYQRDLVRAEELLGNLSLKQMECVNVEIFTVATRNLKHPADVVREAQQFIAPYWDKLKVAGEPGKPESVPASEVSPLPIPDEEQHGLFEEFCIREMADALKLLPRITDLTILFKVWDKCIVSCNKEHIELVEERISDLPLAYEQVVEGYKILTAKMMDWRWQHDEISALKFAIIKGYVPPDLAMVMKL